MTTPDIPTIARKLTKAQREAVTSAMPAILTQDGVVRYRHWRAFPGLVAKGLLEGAPSQRLTPLGLAVRTHLLSQSNTEKG